MHGPTPYPQKCSLLLGNSCAPKDGTQVAAILGVTMVGFDEKYLGLPVLKGRMKDGKFQSTKDKVSKRLNDWSGKYLSSAGKEVLIKAVIQAIPTYSMSIFKFSANLCEELEQMTRNFWWGDEENRKKVHWLAWEKLLKKKNRGGMGFRDLRVFNQALLAKQAWTLIEHLNSLCARLLKAKYEKAKTQTPATVHDKLAAY